MQPYLPYLAIPAFAAAAWFAATQWPINAPYRYQIASVAQIEDPSSLMKTRPEAAESPEIRIDAFVPPAPKPPPIPEPTFVLQSIITGIDVNLASINGKVVQQGDRIEGYRVQRIAEDGVDLTKGKQTRHIPMRPLHELTPVTPQKGSRNQLNAAARPGEEDLSREFWKIFDSLKP